MKATLKFDDGKVIELSQETTNRLRAELVKDYGQLRVDRFRAVRDDGKFITLALMRYSSDVWDEIYGENSNAKAAHLLTNEEVEEIIEGLSEMLED